MHRSGPANWRCHMAWAAVLAANLVIPVLLGLERTRSGGRVGLVGAVILVWAAGHILLARSALSRPVVFGGVITAVSQFFPILQVMAVLTSLKLVTGAHHWVPGVVTDAEAFAATLLAAAQVGTVALVCGIVVPVANKFFDVPGHQPSPSTPSTTQHPRT